MPADLTKDAVLALAKELRPTMDADVLRVWAVDAKSALRRLAPLLEAPGDLREALAETLSDAAARGPAMPPWHVFADAILPLVTAAIAPAREEGAADMRERAAVRARTNLRLSPAHVVLGSNHISDAIAVLPLTRDTTHDHD